jgi:hypothetical protein
MHSSLTSEENIPNFACPGRVRDKYVLNSESNRSIKKFTTNANNGCLGDFGRGKTQTAAIFVGEVPSTFDPTVSEWGNPSF